MEDGALTSLTGLSSMTWELLDYRMSQHSAFPSLTQRKHTHTHLPGYLLTCLGGAGGAQSGAVERFS